MRNRGNENEVTRNVDKNWEREIKKRGGRRKEKSRKANRKKHRIKTKTKIQRIRKQ